LERKWWVLLAVGIGTLMSALDGSVVNTVLPVITREFGSDLSVTGWVVTVYLLVISGLLLTFGRLGDLYGHKRVYVGGFVIFVLGSAICGQALNTYMLIGARAFQALGAAILASNSPAIVTTSFPGRQRGQALGMQATMTYLGLLLGPTVGGYLTVAWGWRSIFYINVPIGLLALVLSLVAIPGAEQRKVAERFDPAGAVAFFVGLVALLLALNRGNIWGWDSPATLGVLAGALALLGLFVWIERHVPHPMLDLGLFCSRLFSAATGSAVFNYLCLYGIALMMPFYLIQARGLAPDRAGLILSAQPLMMAIAAPLAGTLSDRIGSRLLSSVGMAILGIMLAVLSTVVQTTSLTVIVLYLAVIGIGIGVFIAPNSNALMGSAPRHRQGVAAGVLATARNVGMVLGIGLSSAVSLGVETAARAAGRPDAFIWGLHVTFLVLAGAAALGVVTSLTRGKSEPCEG